MMSGMFIDWQNKIETVWFLKELNGQESPEPLRYFRIVIRGSIASLDFPQADRRSPQDAPIWGCSLKTGDELGILSKIRK